MSKRRRSNNRLARGIIGLLLIMWGLNALGANLPFGVFMLVGGLILLGALMRNGQWDQMRGQINEQWRDFSGDFSLRSDDDPFSRQGGSTQPPARQGTARRAARPAGKMHRIAAEAIRKAGQNPTSLPVAPVDIGLLAYETASGTPTLYRETKLPEEVTFVRPFVLLRSPRRARGTIRFEMVDGAGETRFVDETKWELKAGETFVYPETWLPTHKLEDTDGEWQLRISAAGMLLAVHEFMWRDQGGGEFRAYLTGDGEISPDLVDELSGARLDRLSLEDLLDEQDGGLIEMDPEAEAAARRNALIDRQHSRRL